MTDRLSYWLIFSFVFLLKFVKFHRQYLPHFYLCLLPKAFKPFTIEEDILWCVSLPTINAVFIIRFPHYSVNNLSDPRYVNTCLIQSSSSRCFDVCIPSAPWRSYSFSSYITFSSGYCTTLTTRLSLYSPWPLFSLFAFHFLVWYIYFISSSIRWMGTILETIYLRYSNWHCLICTRYLLYLFTLLKDSFALCTNSSLFLALIKMLRSSANPIKFAHFVNYSFRTFVVKVIPQGRP